MIGDRKGRELIKGDLVVWAILLILSMISIVEVYSASSNMTYTKGHFWDPVIQHGGLVCVGLLLAWLMHITNLGIIKLLLLIAYPVSLILLIIVLFTGEEINGAARFIPIFGFTFQPSELAKISLVGVASLILSIGYDNKIKQTNEKYFYAMIVFTIITCLLIFSENLSTAIIIAFVMVLLAWIASPPKKIFYSICLGLVLATIVGYMGLKQTSEETLQRLEGTMLERVITWTHRIREERDYPVDPKEYPIYKNIQETHAKIAVATCGMRGRGVGKSEARDFLPQAYSDFIYAIIIEEGGLFAGGFVVMLYLVLFYRCIRIARRCKNRYPAYLVIGISLMLVTQAMVNMAVAVGVLPITGQTLPLVSKGGTSILMCNMSIGIILKVSYGAKRKEKKDEVTEKMVVS